MCHVSVLNMPWKQNNIQLHQKRGKESTNPALLGRAQQGSGALGMARLQTHLSKVYSKLERLVIPKCTSWQHLQNQITLFNSVIWGNPSNPLHAAFNNMLTTFQLRMDICSSTLVLACVHRRLLNLHLSHCFYFHFLFSPYLAPPCI